MKKIISKIKNNTATEFDLQELVKFFAENAGKLSLGEEVICKSYIKKCAHNLNVSGKDLADVYNSYRKMKKAAIVVVADKLIKKVN